MRNWPFMLFKLVLPPLVCATLVFSQSSSLPARETLYYTIDWRLFTAGKGKEGISATPQPPPRGQEKIHLGSTRNYFYNIKEGGGQYYPLTPRVCSEGHTMTT